MVYLDRLASRSQLGFELVMKAEKEQARGHAKGLISRGIMIDRVMLL
jgi:hypothetical protein